VPLWFNSESNCEHDHEECAGDDFPNWQRAFRCAPFCLRRTGKLIRRRPSDAKRIPHRPSGSHSAQRRTRIHRATRELQKRTKCKNYSYARPCSDDARRSPARPEPIRAQPSRRRPSSVVLALSRRATDVSPPASGLASGLTPTARRLLPSKYDREAASDLRIRRHVTVPLRDDSQSFSIAFKRGQNRHPTGRKVKKSAELKVPHFTRFMARWILPSQRVDFIPTG